MLILRVRYLDHGAAGPISLIGAQDCGSIRTRAFYLGNVGLNLKFAIFFAKCKGLNGLQWKEMSILQIAKKICRSTISLRLQTL